MSGPEGLRTLPTKVLVDGESAQSGLPGFVRSSGGLSDVLENISRDEVASLQ